MIASRAREPRPYVRWMRCELRASQTRQIFAQKRVADAEGCTMLPNVRHRYARSGAGPAMPPRRPQMAAPLRRAVRRNRSQRGRGCRSNRGDTAARTRGATAAALSSNARRSGRPDAVFNIYKQVVRISTRCIAFRLSASNSFDTDGSPRPCGFVHRQHQRERAAALASWR